MFILAVSMEKPVLSYVFFLNFIWREKASQEMKSFISWDAFSFSNNYILLLHFVHHSECFLVATVSWFHRTFCFIRYKWNSQRIALVLCAKVPRRTMGVFFTLIPTALASLHVAVGIRRTVFVFRTSLTKCTHFFLHKILSAIKLHMIMIWNLVLIWSESQRGWNLGLAELKIMPSQKTVYCIFSKVQSSGLQDMGCEKFLGRSYKFGSVTLFLQYKWDH